MSLQFEGSPVSDNKMDFSETPTTDSAGVSPLAEEESQQEQRASRILHQNNHNELTRSGNECTDNNGIVNKVSLAGALDNRIKKPEILSLESSLPQRQIIAARTLANSHPLMSPTNSHDSDSEQCQQVKCNNFPDVIPRTERILQHAETPLAQQTIPLNVVQVRNTLNNQIMLKRTKPQDAKLGMLRASSPDLLSSESDPDVSQYLAAVESSFQSVALIPNSAMNGTGNNKLPANGIGHTSKRLGIGKIAGCEDISSLDSISNHSFDDDEDIEHNLASLSPSSSLIDGLDGEDDDEDCEGPELLPDNDTDLDNFGLTKTPTPNNASIAQNGDGSALPQYTAAEERRDSRNWQKITLPDGRTREIDMRVIEPYKRVLSHGGYLKAGGQNAIVIFCACHLPDRSRADYSYVMDNLFLYVVKTLEQLVTDDYVLVYLHGGSNRRNVPPFPWLKRCYQLLDRRLRKSLKYMYLVHPTFWIKSIVWMARPFVSTKFWRKLIYVKSLEELDLHVAVEKAAIPEKVKQYDAKRH